MFNPSKRKIAVNTLDGFSMVNKKFYSKRPTMMNKDIVDFSDEMVKHDFDQVDAVRNKVANQRARRKVIMPVQKINYL